MDPQLIRLECLLSLGGRRPHHRPEVAGGLGALPGGPRCHLGLCGLEDRLEDRNRLGAILGGGRFEHSLHVLCVRRFVVGSGVEGCHHGRVGSGLFERFASYRCLALDGRRGVGLAVGLPGRSNGSVFGATESDLRPFIGVRGGHHGPFVVGRVLANEMKCVVLYYIVLYCVVLYCIVLYSIGVSDGNSPNRSMTGQKDMRRV